MGWGGALDASAAKKCMIFPQNREFRDARLLLIVAGAAVDVDGLAGDEAAVVADQKQAGGGDLVDLPLAAERYAGGTRGMSPIPLGMVTPGVDAAGRDHV